MKTITMKVARLLVLVALLCSFAYADGEQGSGGFAGSESCAVKADSSLDGEQGSGGYADGEQGSGGFSGGEQGSGGLTGGACEEPDYLKSVMTSVYDYFDAIL